MNIKRKFVSTLCLLLACRLLAGTAPIPALIPLPQKIELHDGVFQLRPETRILADAATQPTAEYLAARLRQSTGYNFAVGDTLGVRALACPPNCILLTTSNPAPGFGAEGYTLNVTQDGVTIRASASAGLFYGAQTLFQLLPPEIFSAKPITNVDWAIPCLQIEDQPRFAWRGLMLDVSRHFFTKDEIKKTLDEMALHKLNVFHWHLVDDQGWRIEIKKYPRLTQVGAWRKSIGFDLDPGESTAYGPDGRYGGFYTQAEIREIVAYAQARRITIVPEIEMPGHSVAALAAYPEFSCTGGPFSTDINAGIFNGIYCAGNDRTFDFLEDVLTEVMELFPGKYIHVGGDEVPKENWEHCAKCQARMKQEGLHDEHELQSYFIRRIEKFIASRGRTLIGWSEIRDGGLPGNAALMDWIGGATEAANAGHDVVMASKDYCYLCYYQSLDRTPDLRANRPYLPLGQSYAFEPIPAALGPQAAAHILGAEGCQWTVYFASQAEVEEMNFPRLCALSEVFWSPKTARDYSDFLRRLPVHERRLAELGVNYWQEKAVKIGEWKPAQISAHDNLLEWEIPPDAVSPGKYRLSLNYTQGRDGLKIDWVALLENGREILRDAHVGFTGARSHERAKARDWNYYLNLPECKLGANYSVKAAVEGEGGTDSSGIVFLETKPLPQ